MAGMEGGKVPGSRPGQGSLLVPVVMLPDIRAAPRGQDWTSPSFILEGSLWCLRLTDENTEFPVALFPLSAPAHSGPWLLPGCCPTPSPRPRWTHPYPSISTLSQHFPGLELPSGPSLETLARDYTLCPPGCPTTQVPGCAGGSLSRAAAWDGMCDSTPPAHPKQAALPCFAMCLQIPAPIGIPACTLRGLLSPRCRK